MLLSLYFSGTISLSAVIAKGISAESYPAYLYELLFPAGIMTAVHFIIYLVILKTEKPTHFITVFSLGSALIILSIIAMNILLFHDCIRCGFHSAAARDNNSPQISIVIGDIRPVNRQHIYPR